MILQSTAAPTGSTGGSRQRSAQGAADPPGTIPEHHLPGCLIELEQTQNDSQGRCDGKLFVRAPGAGKFWVWLLNGYSACLGTRGGKGFVCYETAPGFKQLELLLGLVLRCRGSNGILKFGNGKERFCAMGES